ncbi:MAG: hypothetical protein C4297_04020 [Gemmataceae bacterium]
MQGTPDAQGTAPLPYDLHGLRTYELAARPSKVFAEDCGKPVAPEAPLKEFFQALPKQLMARDLCTVRDRICDAYRHKRVVVAALGGHVIKTGCSPYLVDWIHRGLISAVVLNGAAAIHDFELAYAGKTSEDVAAALPRGQFGMARETADAFAVAARAGAQDRLGLGRALGRYMDQSDCRYPHLSVVLAAYQAQIPCTVHVALGTDIVHMHPHVSGAALGEASLLDFRILCSVVARMKEGVWLNLGSAVLLPEVFLKAVSVVRNFGHDLDGLLAVNLDKQWSYRSWVNVCERPASQGIQLLGCHEILIPLLHAAVACQLADSQPRADRALAA